MSKTTDKKIYFPTRNLVGSLVPILIGTWYFIDKVGSNRTLKLFIIALALIIQVVIIMVSSRTRKTRRAFFWGIYDFLTGNGKLPLRLFVNGLVLITIIAFGFEISGFEQNENISPTSSISRYVEINLYWTALNFLGMSDNSLQPIGFSKVLTVFATASGIIFWGMYISILVNKYTEMQELLKKKGSEERLDSVFYNEGKEKKNRTKRLK